MSPELPPARGHTSRRSNRTRIARTPGGDVVVTLPAPLLYVLAIVAAVGGILAVPPATVSALVGAAAVPLAVFAVATLVTLTFALPLVALLLVATYVR